MFSLLKKITETIGFDTKKTQEERLQQLEAELQPSDDETDPVDDSLAVEPTNCFQKVGRITDIEKNSAEIDSTYRFDRSKAPDCFNELEVGSKVSYLAYRHSEDIPLRIVKVIEIIAELWNGTQLEDKITQANSELMEAKPEFYQVIPRTCHGVVKQKRRNEMTVNLEHSEITFDLDKVEAEFIALVGDCVMLDCDVQVDPKQVDFNGEIVQVQRIRPTRSTEGNGRITRYDAKRNCGVVSNKMFFYSDVLKAGYKQPIEGDKVFYVAVESQGMSLSGQDYEFRCVKVEPVDSVRNEVELSTEPDIDSTLMANKRDIVISDHLNFAFSEQNGEGEAKEITITNRSPDVTKKLIGVSIRCKKSISLFRCVAPRIDERFDIPPGEKLVYRIAANPKFYGAYTEVMVFAFADGKGRFEIGRKLQIEVEDVEHQHPSRGSGPAFRNKQYTANVWNSKLTGDVVPGVKPVKGPNFVDIKIQNYGVPSNMAEAVLRFHTNAEVEEELDKRFKYFQNGLTIINHEAYFHGLLHLEEIQFDHNIRQYDMERACFQREDEYLALYIDNIAERRPSLVVGDSVHASKPWSQNQQRFEGAIHKVKNNRILLKFNQNFQQHYNPGESYKVVFYFSRASFRKQHHALSVVRRNLGQDYLFPNGIQVKPPHKNLSVRTSDLQMVNLDDADRVYPWFNQELNIIQKEAIKNVIRAECRPMPYIIFGPPGTGKTMTLVEVILQLSKASNNNRVLVCTPSNSAANLITERLIDSKQIRAGEFIRIVGYNLIEKELISDKLAPYCGTVDTASERSVSEKNMIITESGLRLKCQQSFISLHRVIISTCSSLGTLMHIAFPQNHFTHTIIDEAGQCTEPESLIPISFMSPQGQVILAGDPMQLGPVVLSQFAIKRGLGKSLLVRMLERTPYLKDKERFENGYDQRLVTKLRNNYRSLPSILSCYSTLFYDDELEPMISATDSDERRILNQVRDLFDCPNAEKTCGLFFIGIKGNEAQDPDSPSWYNKQEASQVMLLLIKLYQQGLKADDIGIITPYQQQVKKIRHVIESCGVAAPKVGSVEEFQGQERNVIIISTVRSKKKLVLNDLKYSLGFVRSEMRLNVAISRARALLVIIGNPHLLCCDTNWRYLLRYSYRKNTYTGCSYPENLSSTADTSVQHLNAVMKEEAEAAAQTADKLGSLSI